MEFIIGIMGLFCLAVSIFLLAKVIKLYMLVIKALEKYLKSG